LNSDTVQLNQNEWLSQVLGSPAFDLHLFPDPTLGLEGIDRLLAELHTFLVDHHARMAALRTEPMNALLLERISLNGFFYIETIMKFVVPLRRLDLAEKQARFRIRRAEERDLNEVITIAASTFSENRLVRDEHFPRSAAQEYYTNWINSSYRLESDEIHVLESQATVKGFFILRKLGDHRVIFLLGGISSEEKRGSPYGPALYSGVFKQLVDRQFKSAEGEILAANLPVVNIFCSLGARFYASEVRYHKWFL
jgi:hypothetical protein